MFVDLSTRFFSAFVSIVPRWRVGARVRSISFGRCCQSKFSEVRFGCSVSPHLVVQQVRLLCDMYGSYRFRQSGDGNCWQDYKRREQKKTDVIQFWRNDIINFGFDVVSRVVSGSLVCKLHSSRESALAASIFVLAVH